MQSVDFAGTARDTLAGRFMRRFWHPVFFACDLSIGRAVPIRIMGDDFTLYRGEGGAAHLVDFRCAHRGTQLSIGWVEGDEIRCRYHGWKYDAAGQCVEAPAERPEVCASVRIRSYPLREYLGLVFAYLGEGEAPAFPTYPEWEKGVLEVTGYDRPCNYFQNLENGVDPIHTPFAHSNSFVSAAGLSELPTVKAQLTQWGVAVETTRSSGVRTILYGVPNISNVKLPSSAGGWKDSLAWRVPIDDQSHRSFILYRHYCSEGEAARAGIVTAQNGRSRIESSRDDLAAILAGQARLEDVACGPDSLVDLQDCVVQVGQGVVVDRAFERLARSDVGIFLLRRIWRQELSALADGGDLTAWSRPPGLLAA